MTAAVTLAALGNGPAFSVYTKTAQSIPSSTFTKIQFNQKTFDTASAYDATTNYRFQPLVAGYYQINANISGGGGTTGYWQCYIFKSTSQYAGGAGIPNNTNVGGKITASTVMYLNGSTDFAEFYVWHNNGTTIALQVADGDNTFSGAMVRGA